MRLPKFPDSISTSVGGMFLKIHTWYSTYILYNECYVSVLLITKGTLREESCIFPAVSQSRWEEYPPPKKNLTLHTHSLENL